MRQIRISPSLWAAGRSSCASARARVRNLRPQDIGVVPAHPPVRSTPEKNDVHLVCTVQVAVDQEEKVLSRCKSKQVSKVEWKPYRFPPVLRPPLPAAGGGGVVGTGPAGLFCRP